VETQSATAARQLVKEFRPRPVHYRHEVVADGLNTAGSEVTHRLALIVEQRTQVAFAELDALVDGQALDNIPVQPERLIGPNQRLALLDRLDAPDLTVRELV